MSFSEQLLLIGLIIISLLVFFATFNFIRSYLKKDDKKDTQAQEPAVSNGQEQEQAATDKPVKKGFYRKAEYHDPE